MDSNTHLDLEHQNHQPNSGLLRFRSAPTSLLTNFVDNNGDLGVNKGNSIEGSDHSDRFFSRFVNYSHTNDSESWPSSLQEFEDKSTVTASRMSAQQQGFPGLPPHYPRQSSFGSGNGSYGLVGSAVVDHHPQAKTVSSNLVRQSSSPAGLFSNSSVQNGRRKWRIDGDIGYQGHPYAISRFGLGSCNRLLNVFQNTIKGTGNMERVVLIGIWEGPSTNKVENSRFPFGAWNDPSNFSENLAGMRRDQDNDVKLFSAAQNGDLGNRIHVLSHHLSLPKNSAEVAMEKFLQFQDSVPCKVRAKRGCATHPRSIAERVRRTRISERMRKLQELVPNMDKQTNTADMLDLAVDYIKELQKQFKSLSDVRANCKCLSMQKPVQNQIV